MREKELLEELYKKSMDMVFILSFDNEMTIPQKGLEEDWEHQKEIAQMLKNLIKERE